jgi:putative CocE/NonD family hydrolase
MVASTQPEELDAIAISGLIDELYRGIVYPGGVGNYGFPAFWTGAYRPAVEVAGNASRFGTETASGDPTCAANIGTRTASPGTVNGLPDNPIVQGLTSPEDDTWYTIRSTSHYIDKINKPILLTQQWQDEQTGPRGSNVLWERLEEVNPDLPKRMVMVNGVHSTTSVGAADRKAWMDCWLINDGLGCGDVLDPAQRVRVHFEEGDGGAADNPAYTSSDWPLPETEWTRFYLQPDGTLATTAPAEGSPSLSYVHSPEGRQSTDETGTVQTGGQLGTVTFTSGPDQLRYTVDFGAETAIAGPINLTLTASSTAVDTDFFIDVIDLGPGGEVSYLQRGMLRASHRQIDASKSDFVPSGSEEGAFYRAHHPHTNTTLNLLTPAQPTQLEIEVFPVGHVVREGHQLAIQLHAPPAKDPISIYAWVSHRAPAVNTVYHGPVAGLAASSILLPIVPGSVPVSAEAPGCGSLVGIPCFTPPS